MFHVDALRPSHTKDIAKERIRNVCFSSFANETQKENHRKAVHPRNLGDEIEDDELKMDEPQAFDIVEGGAVRIIGERKSLFLMLYDEPAHLISSSEDSPHVKDWREDQPISGTDEMPIVTKKNLRKWLTNKNNVDDLMVESDMD